MKIAFFVSEFPSLSETFVVNQITGLLDRGHDVHIYADAIQSETRLHPGYRKYRLLERTRYRRSVLVRSRPRKMLARLALALKNLPRHPAIVLRTLNVFAYGRRAISLYVLDMAMRFVERPAYDIVHCHFGANADDAAILMELGLLKGKLIATFHGYDIRRGIEASGACYARVVRRCDAVHSISAYNRKWLEAFGFEPERITYHPVGIDVASFGPAGKGRRGADTTVRIVTVARLVEEKGLRYLLESLAEVRRRRPVWTIQCKLIGGGPLEQSLKAAARQLELQGIVDFMGPQDQDVVKTALREADLFLLPSVAEALPVSIMEAMASELPVIATDVGSVAEMVQDGRTGRLVPPADAKALARAITEVLDERERWAVLGSAGRALVARNYDVNVLNDRLVAHYRSLLGGDPGSLAAECAAR